MKHTTGNSNPCKIFRLVTGCASAYPHSPGIQAVLYGITGIERKEYLIVHHPCSLYGHDTAIENQVTTGRVCF